MLITVSTQKAMSERKSIICCDVAKPAWGIYRIVLAANYSDVELQTDFARRLGER
jgi:hypothetical protein